MTNQKLRDTAKKCGVHLWQIGEHLGMSDATFSRKLRHELTKEEAEKALAAVRSIAAKNRGYETR